MSQSEDSYRTGEGAFRFLSILRNLKLKMIDNSVLILIKSYENQKSFESLHLYD